VRTSDAAGVARFGPGLGLHPAWTPGLASELQARYRDADGPCGSGFNLSPALTVLATP
jgi:hypothetical protein